MGRECQVANRCSQNLIQRFSLYIGLNIMTISNFLYRQDYIHKTKNYLLSMKAVLCEESVKGKLVVNCCTINNAAERGFHLIFMLWL